MAQAATTWLWLAIAIGLLAGGRGRPRIGWFIAGLVLPVLPAPVGPPMGKRTSAWEDFLIGLAFVGLAALAVATLAAWRQAGW
jgi:ABC-type Mn2+/Zn2+ transport system permease subunit